MAHQGPVYFRAAVAGGLLVLVASVSLGRGLWPTGGLLPAGLGALAGVWLVSRGGRQVRRACTRVDKHLRSLLRYFDTTPQGVFQGIEEHFDALEDALRARLFRAIPLMPDEQASLLVGALRDAASSNPAFLPPVVRKTLDTVEDVCSHRIDTLA